MFIADQYSSEPFFAEFGDWVWSIAMRDCAHRGEREDMAKALCAI